MLGWVDITSGHKELFYSISGLRRALYTVTGTFTFTEFKKVLEEQVNTSCTVLEEDIVQTYEKHSKIIQDKLQELFAVLERISMLLSLFT